MSNDNNTFGTSAYPVAAVRKAESLVAELTDRSSSQMLPVIKELGVNKVRIKLLKSQQLPESTKVILACVDSEFLKVLANTADKIHEVMCAPWSVKCREKPRAKLPSFSRR